MFLLAPVRSITITRYFVHCHVHLLFFSNYGAGFPLRELSLIASLLRQGFPQVPESSTDDLAREAEVSSSSSGTHSRRKNTGA